MKVKIRTMIKHLKPVEYDIHIKYICPNCSGEHWVSDKEAKYEKFIIVCSCGDILKPKIIESIRFKYRKRKHKQTPIITTETSSEILEDIIKKCSDALVTYGFELKEAEERIRQAYNETNSKDYIFLVKHALLKLGEKHGSSYEAD